MPLSRNSFTGRSEELMRLESVWQTDRFGCVLVYGRKGMGKTQLVHEFCRSKEAFIFNGYDFGDELHRRLFAEDLERLVNHPVDSRDWSFCLSALATFLAEKHCIVVLENFDSIVRKSPCFLGILNEVFSETNILIVLTLSDVRLVKRKILKAPEEAIYLADAIELKPLSMRDIRRWMPHLPPADLQLGYAVFGGTPAYWRLIDQRKSMQDNIASLVLMENGRLHREPEDFVKENFRAPAPYFTILSVIATGKCTRAAIAVATGIDNRNLTPYLKALMDIGLIEENSRPERSYTITDPFFAFWFRFVAPVTEPIESLKEALEVFNCDIEPLLSAGAK